MLTRLRTLHILPALLLVALTACDRADDDPGTLPDDDIREDTRETPVVNQDKAIEGMYALADVNGSPPPAIVSQSGDCRVEIIDATIRMEAQRFAFQNRTREVCANGRVGEVIMHAAGGSYVIEGNNLVMTAELGAAFSGARATATNDDILIQELTTDAGAEPVNWRFHRRDQQMVPVPGTTGPAGPPPAAGG